jgi:hypothetical protein
VSISSPSPLPATLEWTEGDQAHSALWRSERGNAAPKKVVLADDTMNADTAYRLACEGTGLLWRGDFHNARMLLQALARRTDRLPERQQFKANKLAARASHKAASASVAPKTAAQPQVQQHPPQPPKPFTSTAWPKPSAPVSWVWC